MRGSSRYLFVAVALCALAWSAPAALAAKPKVKILSDGQSAILAKGSIKARSTVAVRRGRTVKVAVKGRSATFDQPRFAKLTGPAGCASTIPARRRSSCRFVPAHRARSRAARPACCGSAPAPAAAR